MWKLLAGNATHDFVSGCARAAHKQGLLPLETATMSIGVQPLSSLPELVSIKVVALIKSPCGRVALPTRLCLCRSPRCRLVVSRNCLVAEFPDILLVAFRKLLVFSIPMITSANLSPPIFSLQKNELTIPAISQTHHQAHKQSAP